MRISENGIFAASLGLLRKTDDVRLIGIGYELAEELRLFFINCISPAFEADLEIEVSLGWVVIWRLLPRANRQLILTLRYKGDKKPQRIRDEALNLVRRFFRNHPGREVRLNFEWRGHEWRRFQAGDRVLRGLRLQHGASRNADARPKAEPAFKAVGGQYGRRTA